MSRTHYVMVEFEGYDLHDFTIRSTFCTTHGVERALSHSESGGQLVSDIKKEDSIQTVGGLLDVPVLIAVLCFRIRRTLSYQDQTSLEQLRTAGKTEIDLILS